MAGPADDGAVGKYSDSEYEDGVRQIDGMGEAGDVGVLPSESESGLALLLCLLAAAGMSRSNGSFSRRPGATLRE